MRKPAFAVAAGIAALVLGGTAVAAPVMRTEEQPYTGANGARAEDVEAHVFVSGNPEDVRFQARPGERRVTLSIEDQSGLPAFGAVRIYDRGGELATTLDFCGAMAEPVSIPASATVGVRLMGGVCDDGTPVVATTGVVVATFGR